MGMVPLLVSLLAGCLLASAAPRDPCFRPCPHTFEQVCGNNNVTYSNPCIMVYEACNEGIEVTVAYEGPCKEQLETKLKSE